MKNLNLSFISEVKGGKLINGRGEGEVSIVDAYWTKRIFINARPIFALRCRKLYLCVCAFVHKCVLVCLSVIPIYVCECVCVMCIDVRL